MRCYFVLAFSRSSFSLRCNEEGKRTEERPKCLSDHWYFVWFVLGAPTLPEVTKTGCHKKICIGCFKAKLIHFWIKILQDSEMFSGASFWMKDKIKMGQFSELEQASVCLLRLRCWHFCESGGFAKTFIYSECFKSCTLVKQNPNSSYTVRQGVST